ncbi:TetR/AcrR family transcriptional regulator [Nocardia salmonicida]|uniref:TetR/AcrR family transcriptional regulator n=1 Tax=Nocardia salmonicida TaxID=53431 RepID=UPI0036353551
MASSDEPNAQKLSHKERLLRQGTRTFYSRGFHGTTVDMLLAESGVPKGSFYHHFGSKETFGQAVLERYNQYQETRLRHWLTVDGMRLADRISGYFHEMTESFIGSGYERGCLAGKFATEVASTSAVFRAQLDTDLRTLKALLVTALEQGQQDGEVRTDRGPDDIADSLLALIQGAFVIALATRDAHSLDAVNAALVDQIVPRI